MLLQLKIAFRDRKKRKYAGKRELKSELFLLKNRNKKNQ